MPQAPTRVPGKSEVSRKTSRYGRRRSRASGRVTARSRRRGGRTFYAVLTDKARALKGFFSSVPREVWGFFLLLAFVMSAIVLWFPQAAPVSSVLSKAVRGLLGRAAAVVPIALGAVAIELMRKKGRSGRIALGVLGMVAGATTLGGLWLGDYRNAAGDVGLVGSVSSGLLKRAVGRPLADMLVISAILVLVSMGLGIPVWRPAVAFVSFIDKLVDKGKSRQRGGSAELGEPSVSETSQTFSEYSLPGRTASEEILPDWPEAAASKTSLSSRPKISSRQEEKVRGRLRDGDPTPSQLELKLSQGGSAFTETSYPLPPLKLLRQGSGFSISKQSLEEIGRVLIETLRQFEVEASLSGITPGPTVTRFEVELAPGVKVAKVKGLSDDIAYALAAESVRIQAPIPGKSAIGIEIPNRERRLVTVGDVLTSTVGKAAKHPLDCALGKDISGKPVMINLGEMPHLLIAGTTGGGKSSTINALVTSLIMRNGPEQVRLLLVDPKRVELGVYDGIPHLLTRVVTNPKKASEALGWVVREMELRYEKLAELGVRDLTSYNSMVIAQGGHLAGEAFEHKAMGYIVVIVDELNDLMMVAARDVEDSIMRLAQMARAVGIHLVIATQRPSTNVITGVIKANIPSRIAFKVGSQVDSRVILDTGGAEELVGMGDMLLLTASSGVPKRIQGCFVSEEEVRKIVAYWRRLVPKAQYLDEVVFSAPETDTSATEEDDELLDQAMDLVVRTQLGSTSMLQRKLRVGFARAGRLMDLLEKKGVVGPSEGSKARAVLVSLEEYEEFKRKRSIDDRGNPD